MVYITLKELKKVLPGILDQWIDKEDEGWEWVFNEIEQKCRIGKHLKDKKWKKKLRDDVDKLQYFRHHDYEIKVNGIATKVNQLNKEIEEIHRKHIDEGNSMSRELARIHSDIRSVKSMAQTAKQRTEVDYADVVQEVYNRMVGRGATREELDTFRNLIQKYDALEKKEIFVKKDCLTCKNLNKPALDQPCVDCIHSAFNITGSDKWEAKDNA